MKLNLQKNVIRFRLTNIYPVDERLNKSKKVAVKINTSEIFGFSKSILFRYLLSGYHRLTVLYMSNKIVTN